MHRENLHVIEMGTNEMSTTTGGFESKNFNLNNSYYGSSKHTQ